MDAPTSKLAVVPDQTLKILDEVLSNMADGVEVIKSLAADGQVPSEALLDSMLKSVCLARYVVIVDRESGAEAWEMLEKAAGR